MNRFLLLVLLLLPFASAVDVEYAIDVYGAIDLSGVQFNIQHNPSFQYVGLIEGVFLSQDNVSTLAIEPNVTSGLLSDFMLFRMGSFDGVNGSGELVVFVFNSTSNATPADFNLTSLIAANSDGGMAIGSFNTSIYNDGALYVVLDTPDAPDEPEPTPELLQEFDSGDDYTKQDLKTIVSDGIGTVFAAFVDVADLIVLGLFMSFVAWLLHKIPWKSFKII